MCGVSGALIRSKDHKYWDLLRASEIRGQDGTGISVLHKGAYLTTYRFNCKASEIPLAALPVLEPGDFVIGQNRLAIFGLDSKNNQPILGRLPDVDSALVHNGNLYDFENAFKKYGLRRSLDVDTELISKLLDRYLQEPRIPLSEAITYVGDRVKGNFACLYLRRSHVSYDATMSVFLRDKPLWVANETSGTYFFSTDRIGKKVFPELYAIRKAPHLWSFDLFDHSPENLTFAELPNGAVMVIDQCQWIAHNRIYPQV